MLLIVLASQVHAQAQQTPAVSVEKFDRQLQKLREQQFGRDTIEQPLDRRFLFDYGGYITPQFLSIQDQSNGTHTLRQLDVTTYADLSLDGVHDLYARGRFTRQDFSRGDSFDGEGDRSYEIVDRLYYRFDLQRALSLYQGVNTNDNLVLVGGRQLIDWANGLVLNQVMDGVLAGASIGPLDLNAIAAQTSVQHTIGFDSSRPNFDTHDRRAFYGALATLQLGQQRPFLYFLRQDDHNTHNVLHTGPVDTRFHYSSYYVGAGASGTLNDKLSYSAELVYEGGRSLSNSFTTAGGFLSQVPQQNDGIEAYAGDARLDYAFPDERRTRLSTEVIFATGDRDRLNTSNTFGGNKPGSRDHSFNAFGLLNTGLAFNPNISNIGIFRIGATTFPFPNSDLADKLQTGVDVFLYSKFSNGAPIDESSNSAGGQFLGGEPDVFLNWQIASDVTVAMRYGVFFPDKGVFPLAQARQFFYASMTLGF